MLKFLHNEKMSLAWAILVELAVHALFAFQAFLLGGFLGEIALTSIFGSYGQAIGAWVLALFVFGAAFQAFVLGEYMREHVESFETTSKGNGSYIRSWAQVRWLVAGIEVSSLLFRCIFVFSHDDWLQSLIVLLFGVISLWYAFAQAKVIHASVNRPVEYDVMRAQQEAGRSLVKDAIDYTRYMSPEQKSRFVDGDVSAVEEVAQARFFEEEQKRQSKQTRMLDMEQHEEEQRQQQERARETARNLFNPKMWGRKPAQRLDFLDAQTSSQADRLSQNGRH